MLKHPQHLSQYLSGFLALYKPTKSVETPSLRLAPFELARVFYFSLNTFLDVSAVGGVVAGCLSDGALLAHQKRHLKAINLFLFLSKRDWFINWFSDDFYQSVNWRHQ